MYEQCALPGIDVREGVLQIAAVSTGCLSCLYKYSHGLPQRWLVIKISCTSAFIHDFPLLYKQIV